MNYKQFLKLLLFVFLTEIVVTFWDPTCVKSMSFSNYISLFVPIVAIACCLIWYLFRIRLLSSAIISGIGVAIIAYFPLIFISSIIIRIFGSYTIIELCR